MSVVEIFGQVKGRVPSLAPFTLKEKQLEVLNHLTKGKDTLAVLPTGYGKTLIFAIYPLLCDAVSNILP
jgi:replicative superfamily II helicase